MAPRGQATEPEPQAEQEHSTTDEVVEAPEAQDAQVEEPQAEQEAPRGPDPVRPYVEAISEEQAQALIAGGHAERSEDGSLVITAPKSIVPR